MPKIDVTLAAPTDADAAASSTDKSGARPKCVARAARTRTRLRLTDVVFRARRSPRRSPRIERELSKKIVSVDAVYVGHARDARLR